jgi:CDP-paratose 2-epimerase
MAIAASRPRVGISVTMSHWLSPDQILPPLSLSGATVLITGGAGFVGSHLARSIALGGCGTRVIAFDNLRRGGVALHVTELQDAGVEFVHGDVRCSDDLAALPHIDLLLDCAADAAVPAGARSPAYVVQTNLVGTSHCLELARRMGAAVVFLSTSRVYSIAGLNRVAVEERDSRFEIAERQDQPGVSARGISTDFSLRGPRSLYGATKLASELLLEEYGATFGLPFVINRLGVVAGPGQMGTEEQGVFAYWMGRHLFGGRLEYRGWGGQGKQIRDVLHVDDVWALVRRQLDSWSEVVGRIYNAGGGSANTVSLTEVTRLASEITGRQLVVESRAETTPLDVRVYVSDNTAVTRDTGWQPSRGPRETLADIAAWMNRNESRLAPLFR